MADPGDHEGPKTSITPDPANAQWTSVTPPARPPANGWTTVQAGAVRPAALLPGTRVTLRERTVEIMAAPHRAGEADVYEVAHADHRYALKIYRPDHLPDTQVLDRWLGINHQHIVHLVEYGQLPDSGVTYELLEWYAGGSLREHFKKGQLRDLDRLQVLVGALSEGLYAFHQAGIIHRDLKPDNILLQNDRLETVGVTDLGIASVKRADETSVHTVTEFGTHEYLAPEQYTNFGEYDNPSFRILPATDFYSLGLILLEGWLGRRPFAVQGAHSGASKALRLQGVPLPKDMPRRLAALLRGLLAVEPSRRYGYAEVQKWLKREPLPEVVDEVQRDYPPIQFRLATGGSVSVTSPAQLANLFVEHPIDGARFLYGWPVKQSQWAAIDPGLCDLLRQIVEDEFPKDQASGMLKATYLLDPSLPYKSPAGTVLNHYGMIAADLSRDPDKVKALSAPVPHPVWIFLDTRPPMIAADAKKFRAAIRASDAQAMPDRVASFLVWLQGLDGEKACLDLPFNRTLRSVDDLRNAPADEQAHFAARLADAADPLAIWVARMEPSLKMSIGRFRVAQRLDAIGLRFALDSGVLLADGTSIIEPGDLFAPARGSLWALRKGEPVADLLDSWFQNYRCTMVQSLGLEWLTTCPKSDLVPTVSDRVLAEWDSTGRPLAEVVGTVLMALSGVEWTNERKRRVVELLSAALGQPSTSALTGSERVRQLVTEALRWPEPAALRWREILDAVAPAMAEEVRGDYVAHAKAPGVLAEVHAARMESVALMRRESPAHALVQRFDDEERELQRLTVDLAAQTKREHAKEQDKVDEAQTEGVQKLYAAAVEKFDKTKPGVDLNSENTLAWILFAVTVGLGMGVGVKGMPFIIMGMGGLFGAGMASKRGGFAILIGVVAGLFLAALLLQGMRALMLAPVGWSLLAAILGGCILWISHIPRKKARLIADSVDDQDHSGEFDKSRAKLSRTYSDRFDVSWWELRARLATEQDPRRVNA